MKLEDLGIDSSSGHHNKTLTHTENCFLGLLWVDHVGAENKIGANELAVRFDFAIQNMDPWWIEAVESKLRWFLNYNLRELGLMKRTVRHLHNHLVMMHDNISILSKAGIGGGYWIAESKEEADGFYESFRKRGMTGLVKASRGKKAALVDMMQQITFEFEDLAVDIGIIDSTDMSGDPAAIAVVDSFLGRMLEDPERFSSGLKKLSKKYGSVLLDKTEVAAMKEKAVELSRLVNALGI
ncbi:MAG: hypothetical protein JRD05_08795 [Deltaproteobacteria bacterium]|nr:hypothetical protein [Deltaproteobacteria bacterium]